MSKLLAIEILNYSEGSDIRAIFDNRFVVSTYLSDEKRKDPEAIADKLEHLAFKIRAYHGAEEI